MAQATVTVAINAFPKGIDISQRNAHLYGTLTIGAAGGTYVTNGLPVDFNSVAYDLRLPVKAGEKAFFADLWSTSGFEYAYDPVHFTVRIYVAAETTGAPLVEAANGAALPAGVTSDTIFFHAVIPRG